MKPRSMHLRRPNRRSFAMLMVAGCFFGSALLRLGDVAPAYAEELASAAAPAATPSEAEMSELLAVIRERTAQLDARETALEERLALLRLAEEEFEKKRQELIAAEERLSATLALADGAAERDIAQLTAIYENVKPKRAAVIFQEMNAEFAAGVLGRMTPQTAADILSLMEADKAYTISVILAARNLGAGAAPPG